MNSHRSSPSPPPTSSSKLKVAVIGAGASGLVAARVLSKRGIHPTIFEKAPSTGGVWNYSKNEKGGKLKKEHPMYRGLRTNLPKEIMAFRELPWTRTLERSYVTFQEVLDYLRDYERIFDLTKYIHFGCSVTQLTVLPNNVQRSAIQLPPSLLTPQNGTNEEKEEEIWPQIQLEWQQRQDNSLDSAPTLHKDTFDAVVICNGHYAVPSIPNLPGLKEYFHGTVLHSIEYDDPSDFTGQTVLCVGGRASGSDVAREISHYADHVYVSDTSCSTPRTLHNITLVPRTERVLPTGEICFEGMLDDADDANGDGSSPTKCPKVDTIIFCSGYDYDFPFINNDSNLPLDVGRGERRVKPVFEQLWHAVYPNIAFIGLPHSILPFPLFEFQAHAIVHQWTLSASSSSSSSSSHNTTLQMPPLAERKQCAESDAISGGSKTHGRVPQDTHYLGSAQWDYCRRMAQYADAYDAEAERYIATNKAICDHSSSERKSIFPGGPDVYRETRYQRGDDQESFGIVASPVVAMPEICVKR